MKTPLCLITGIFAVLGLMLCSHTSFAGSAIWDLNPGSGDWNTATNWRPATVPDGSSDTATFELSNTTNVSISANTEVNGITFTPTASAYNITVNPNLTLTISGVGITNNSGMAQDFVAAVNGAGNVGRIVFNNSATAGSMTVFTNSGATASGAGGGITYFNDHSTAGGATINNNAATVYPAFGGITFFNDHSTAGNATINNKAGVGFPGALVFNNSSTAGNATIINNSGRTYFEPAVFFNDSSTAGNATIINNSGAFTQFFNTSTAANSIITNNGSAAFSVDGGLTLFDHSTTAANGTFTNNGATVGGAEGGHIFFYGSSTAANGMITNNSGTTSGATGGFTYFSDTTTAGNATIINDGATVSGAGGGETIFSGALGTATAGNATLIANGGTGGGQGGTILFKAKSTGGTPRVEVFGNGNLDISFHRVTIGSIEGDGNAFLGAKNLTVGSNNLSTTFSGVIQNAGQNGGTGGSLTKIGSGTLDLTGANTYTGDTKIRGGVLQVDGSITSNTFLGGRSTLAGRGTVHGNVTNNGGTVSPGDDAPGTLTVNNNYTQGSNGRLLIDIAGPNAGEFSVLDVLGNANLDGILHPVLLNGFIPTVGESFTFLDYTALTGTFSRIETQPIDHLIEQWSVTYHATYATLTAGSTRNVPDQGSTLLLLTLSLLGLATYRQKCWE